MRAEASQPRDATSHPGAQPGQKSSSRLWRWMRKTPGGEHGAPGPSSCLPSWTRLGTGSASSQGTPVSRARAVSSPARVHQRSVGRVPPQVPSCSLWAPCPYLCAPSPALSPSLKQPLSLVQSESESALEQLPLNAFRSEPKRPFPAGPSRPVPWRPPGHPASVRRRPCSFWDARPGCCKRSPPSCESPSSPCGASRVRPSLRPSADAPDSLPRCGLLLPGASPRWGLRSAASRLREARRFGLWFPTWDRARHAARGPAPAPRPPGGARVRAAAWGGPELTCAGRVYPEIDDARDRCQRICPETDVRVTKDMR